MLDRSQSLAALQDDGNFWDLIVVGGGATGLGIAVDAAQRGLRTCLLEAADFAHGTSSRSTKIIHGGVRYLRQGEVGLVRRALRERRLLYRNAPHLVQPLEFLIPTYSRWERTFYGTGLKLYDSLAADETFPESRFLSRTEVIERLPAVESAPLRGAIAYWDGQFDDARLAVELAATAASQGASLANYVRVEGFPRLGDGRICGVRCRDLESQHTWEVFGKAVISATGPFTDAILRLDGATRPVMRPSRGTHLVFDTGTVPLRSALMVPKTKDGRVLFAVPWQGSVIVGTTDVPVDRVDLEPRAEREEVDFILTTLNQFLRTPVEPHHIRSIFTGIRPLVGGGQGGTADLSRDHQIWVNPTSGLFTIAGGKWTTYREMAEAAVDFVVEHRGLSARQCATHDLAIHRSEADDGLDAQVRHACRHEMARCLDDFLSRRTRRLLTDAREALRIAPEVAVLMAEELGRDEAWQTEQLQRFHDLAQQYLV